MELIGAVLIIGLVSLGTYLNVKAVAVLRKELILANEENDRQHRVMSRYIGSLCEEIATKLGIELVVPLSEQEQMFKAMLKSDPTFSEGL